MFRNLSAEETGIDFSNTLQYSDSLTVLDFEYMFNGAGVALLDVNKDGLLDVLFTGNMVSAKLYLNKGHLKFEDITRSSGITTTGWCYGASVVDINQDGYPDVYICKAGNRNTPAEQMRNLFFINNGNNTFTESAAKMGLDDDGYDVQAAFLDYDHDGDLDMYLLRNGFVNYNRNTVRLKQTDGQAATTNRLFRNNGDGTFSNVSKEAGITIEGFGLGVSICDINNDGWPDVYVSNDFLTNDLIWINNRNGTFTNKADQMLRHTTYNAMGNDVADFNNDGREDITEVDMLPPDNQRWKLTMMGNTYEQFNQGIDFGYQPQYVRNSLQLNNGDGTFSEIGQLAGVAATEWSWAPLFADFDNDGLKDLFVANGYRQDITNLDFIMYGKRSMMGTSEANRRDRINKLRDYPGIKVPNYIFKNNGDLTFKDLSKEWGMDDHNYSNGAAYGDLDNDGDLDLVINNLDQPASVYENRSDKINPRARWLRINFRGPTGNREGLGAKVYVWQGTRLQYEYFSPCRGYLSSVEPYLHFGFDENPVDSLKIVWPDGQTQTMKNIPVDTLLTLSYTKAGAAPVHFSTGPAPVFTSYNDQSKIHYRHKEDEFVDFKLQPLMPHMLSHEGPGISIGDVDGDGREDFYIGAAAGSRGAIFLQQANGSFLPHELADSTLADNMGSLLFDADNDGDNDLYIASGGLCAKKNGDTVYQPALYLNNGHGEFTKDLHALPPINTSSASVIAADYDHDGDLDLFVCGRVSPGDYPLAPPSFLLRNDAGKGSCRFTNVTGQSGIHEKGLGMVTSALWTDFDNDGWQDLVVVGEFMPIRFFHNNKGKFREITTETGLAHTNGWWNSLAAGDFDHDGDMDYVVGNLGLNGPCRASAAEPVCIYASDFDHNGRLDPVMCHFYQGKEYTVHSRDDMNKQMTAMRARFRDYASYAGASFQEAFTSEEIAGATVVKAETFASAYLENLGHGKFSLHELPVEAQFAPIYGMICRDLTGDGNLDVLCVGNSYATEVQTGRYDAQSSVLLAGNGKGHFVAHRNVLAGTGDNKALAQLVQADGSSLLLVTSNNDSLRSYHLNVPVKKVISILPGDAYAILTSINGSTTRQEFYFGSTYLSQSGRSLTVDPDISQVVIYTTQGKSRPIKF